MKIVDIEEPMRQFNMLFQRQRAKLVAALEILAGRRPRAPAQPTRTSEMRGRAEQREA